MLSSEIDDMVTNKEAVSFTVGSIDFDDLGCASLDEILEGIQDLKEAAKRTADSWDTELLATHTQVYDDYDRPNSLEVYAYVRVNDKVRAAFKEKEKRQREKAKVRIRETLRWAKHRLNQLEEEDEA